MHNQKAFTLIELLVVVLIIGILAAVALPQYKKAVTKARFSEAFANLKTLSQAKQVCQLTNPRQACWGDNLDVSVEDNEYFMYQPDIDIHYVAAQYQKEDVCLCLYPSGKFLVRQFRESTDCLGRGKEAKMDYAKLLNVLDSDDLDEDEEEGYCACC